MNPERHERIGRIFLEARQLSAESRERLLKDACGDDEELRAHVDSLLRHDEEASRIFASRRGGSETRTELPEPGPDDLGSVGPYRLLTRIGEGGMGVVYEAEQQEPVHRLVALKVIRHDLDSGQVLARFESERQALALMNHPNIARVLDAGTDRNGRPYFAMELIKGVPITDYCDRHNLSTQERLELVIQVCDGVQHAHQKGIIHRDIKPSNILVEIRDDNAVPKIIDFGVAKAIDRRLTERTLFTEHGQIIGTPEYMSPEQAEMTGLDIDTRTDVYSLGVLLYELLVGALPFDSRQLRSMAFDEMRRVIREETPHKPSTKFSTLGAATTDIAKHRGADPASLIRLCRGDLDWITMKSLEKDRTHRYGSASELANDLRHHLRNEPVLAGPPSVRYRMGKFVRRHRMGVGVTAALVMMFLVGFAGTAYGLVRAVRAERQTRLEAATAAEFEDLMLNTVYVVDPEQITARGNLDVRADRVRDGYDDRPALKGRLMRTLGKVYRSLGLYEDAERLLEASEVSLAAAHGEAHAEVSQTLVNLAGVYLRLNRGDEALRLLERAQRIQDQVLPPDHPQRAAALNNFGNVHRLAERYEEALPYYEESLRIRESLLGADDPEVAKMLNQIGQMQKRLGDVDSAADSFARCLAIRERILGPDHPDVAKVLNNIGELRRKTEEYELAREAIQRAIAIQEKTLAPEHPHLVATWFNLGLVEFQDGRLSESRDCLERALAIGEKSQHRLLPLVTKFLVDVTRKLGDSERAEELEGRLEETRSSPDAH